MFFARSDWLLKLGISSAIHLRERRQTHESFRNWAVPDIRFASFCIQASFCLSEFIEEKFNFLFLKLMQIELRRTVMEQRLQRILSFDLKTRKQWKEPFTSFTEDRKSAQDFGITCLMSWEHNPTLKCLENYQKMSH